MSLTKEILRITARYHPLGYSQLFEHLYKETVHGKKLNRNTLEATLSRMKKSGLLQNKDRKWSITSEGKISLHKKDSGIRKFFLQEKVGKNRDKSKNLIIIFDIPERKKNYREWLRMELVGFGFTMVQKSVWFGPALPKEFVKYLGEIGILKYIRFFRAAEKDII